MLAAISGRVSTGSKATKHRKSQILGTEDQDKYVLTLVVAHGLQAWLGSPMWLSALVKRVLRLSRTTPPPSKVLVTYPRIH